MGKAEDCEIAAAYDLPKVHNVAHLFAGSLHIYDAWKPVQLVPENLHERATFNPKMMNRETDQSLGLATGCYPDGAVAIFDRDTSERLLVAW